MHPVFYKVLYPNFFENVIVKVDSPVLVQCLCPGREAKFLSCSRELGQVFFKPCHDRRVQFAGGMLEGCGGEFTVHDHVIHKTGDWQSLLIVL
jgi:hypothetical protein